MVHPDFLEVVRYRIKSMTEGQEVVMPLIEEKFKRIDGTFIDVEVMATGFSYRGKPAVQVVFRDIRSRKAAEDALKETNKKLRLLSSITRHDIQNQIHLVSGYMEIIKENIEKDPIVCGHMRIVEQSLQKIRDHIAFTRCYESLGSDRPIWANVTTTAAAVARKMDLSGINVDVETGPLEIFTDQLIEKVFSSLIENSLKYGENVHLIRIYAAVEDRILTLFYEDEGAGIPVEEKSFIFERGYGVNSGLGLFLTREILGITGIRIRECGDFGKCARFEIKIPQDGFRFSQSS